MYMRKLHTFISICAFFLCTTQLFSQVVIKSPNLSVEPSGTAVVEITVENFDDIVSLQFATSWNSNVLQFDSILHDFVLDGMVAKTGLEDNFGPNPVSDVLRFSWFQPSTEGQSLADDSAIFKIAFNVVGALGMNTPINFGPDGTLVVEAVNKDGDEVPVEFEFGTVMVGPNATSEPNNPDFTLAQNFPNPFNTETVINFELKNNSEATLSIFDLSGKVIFSNEGNFGSGEHNVFLQRDLFPAAGTYFYQLKTTDYIATRKLVVF